jgi:hypothetical protein
MNRDHAFQNAVSAVRAATQDFNASSRQQMNRALQASKEAGFTDTAVFDAARGFSNDDLTDHS